MVDASPHDEDDLPRAVRVAGAWAWRIVLFFAVGWILLQVIARLDLMLIPVIVATSWPSAG